MMLPLLFDWIVAVSTPSPCTILVAEVSGNAASHETLPAAVVGRDGGDAAIGDRHRAADVVVVNTS